MPSRIAVVGSINVDLVASCERLPRPGETVTGATLMGAQGGKGANQAVAAARLGAQVTMLGCVGDDERGRSSVAALLEAGVGTERIVQADEPTGVALIVVAQDGENQIVVAPGANLALRPEHLDLRGYDAVLTQLEIPVETVAAASDAADGLFCVNAAPAQPLPSRVLRRADLVVVNRHELEAIDVEQCRGLVAVTLGEEGAMLLDGGEEIARATPASGRGRRRNGCRRRVLCRARRLAARRPGTRRGAPAGLCGRGARRLAARRPAVAADDRRARRDTRSAHERSRS